MRGVRVSVPPLHGLGDVIGLCLLLVALLFVVRWLLGGSPLQDLAGFLSPPAMATLLEIEVGLAATEGVRQAVDSNLPVVEKVSPSAAVALAQDTGTMLLAQREWWRFGSLRCARIRESDGLATWDAACRRAQTRIQPAGETGGSGNGQSQGVLVVTLVSLVTGRSVRTPGHVAADEVAHFVKGMGLLEPRYLAAFGAISSPDTALLSEPELHATYPELAAL